MDPVLPEHLPQNATRDTVECLLQVHKTHVDWLGKLPRTLGHPVEGIELVQCSTTRTKTALLLLYPSRVVLPISVEEYQVAQLYSVAEASKNETGGGEGVEVLKNEPYAKEDGEKGQYTHKIYHLQSKVPGFVRMLAPASALKVHEKAWNAYPYCRTTRKMGKRKDLSEFDKGHIVMARRLDQSISKTAAVVGCSRSAVNEYMKDNFMIMIETWHKPDIGDQENVHKLDPETWKKTEVVYIDIADRRQVEDKDYKPEEDPATFKSTKTGRGPLGPQWRKELPQKTDCPHMCAYKLVTVKFKWFGLQNKVEGFIHKQEKRLFTNFHRQLFCWMDRWIDLTMDDIRRMEEETQKELDKMREKDPVKGMSASDE
ncbi:hypothetical protein QTP70_015188 [Hemibagrus guttatus]|uniref:Phosphatidylinositol transfer protein alpha isoform n=1 Tax=Hemibagrus guttatus TaxID=175788 RepID=A0AAE0V015_9TELE|nr:hypothetical protein QTP70_015188 [Hemibagrus guttatus]KAK3561156.1 hypothetical protein QTP86_028385 [Hemibagrus guttatus]